MPEPIETADLDRPLEWWEEAQVDLWIEFSENKGFPDIAAEARGYREDPKKWRELRKRLRSHWGEP